MNGKMVVDQNLSILYTFKNSDLEILCGLLLYYFVLTTLNFSDFSIRLRNGSFVFFDHSEIAKACLYRV